MSKTVKEFLDQLSWQVGNAIYVWGGNGEIVTDMLDPEAWIRKHETSEANGERAVKLYRKLKVAGKTIRAFDCSGLIYWCLKQIDVLPRDLNSRGLYAKCTPIDKADCVPGDLVFRHNGTKISHVGAYVGDGKTIECIGRDRGVVVTKLSASYWNRAGRFPGLIDAAVTDEDYDEVSDRTLTVQSPYMRGDDVKALQDKLLALGYSVGKSGADGVYGNDTAGAVQLLTANAAKCAPTRAAGDAVFALLGIG